MSYLLSEKLKIYNSLLVIFLLLVPVSNLGVIRFGFRSLFHDDAELALFLLYAAPLWLGFIIFIGFELYRQTIMQITPGRSLVGKMALGGFAFSALAIIVCPVGPSVFSFATVKLVLANTIICGALGLCLRYLLRLRQDALGFDGRG